jgi:hypothetical protein
LLSSVLPVARRSAWAVHESDNDASPTEETATEETAADEKEEEEAA